MVDLDCSGELEYVDTETLVYDSVESSLLTEDGTMRGSEILECHHRCVKGGGRQKEFCLFQGHLFEAVGDQVQYHLQGRPVPHLKGSGGGGLHPCLTRHLRYRKRR